MRGRGSRIGAAAVASIAGVLCLFGAVRPASAVVVERIVAVVGDRAVLLSELRTRAKPGLIQIQQNAPPGAPQAAAESQMFKELLEKMIEEELEAQAADRAHLTASSEEIDRAIRNIAASQNMTVAQLMAFAREKFFLTEQEYREEIRRQIIEGKLLQLRVKGRLRVTEEDVRTMYERVIRDEKKRREYHPTWITLHVLPGSSPQAVEERRQLAEQIVEQARHGADFAALAKQYSDDTQTRDNGGDLGIRAPIGSQAQLMRKREALGADLENAVMPLEPGQVTAPIELPDPSNGGQNIIILKLVSRQPSRYTSYEAAKNDMLQLVQAEMLGREKRKWLDELRQRTHVEVRL